VVAVAAQVYRRADGEFCTRDDPLRARYLIRICAEIRDHLHEQTEKDGAPVEARGAVILMPWPRQPYVRDPNEELGLIQRQLGDVPWWVFYANGEIGGQTLYVTGVLTSSTNQCAITLRVQAQPAARRGTPCVR